MAKKPWKDLKQNQKLRIAEKFYQTYLRFYLENGEMPEPKEAEGIRKTFYHKVVTQNVCMGQEEYEHYFRKRTSGYEERIMRDIEDGMTLQKLDEKKVKKTPAEKRKNVREKNAIRRQKRKKQKELKEQLNRNLEQDDRFFYIAGYTAGGAPYGVTWEEMGMDPWDEDNGEEMPFN